VNEIDSFTLSSTINLKLSFTSRKKIKRNDTIENSIYNIIVNFDEF